MKSNSFWKKSLVCILMAAILFSMAGWRKKETTTGAKIIDDSFNKRNKFWIDDIYPITLINSFFFFLIYNFLYFSYAIIIISVFVGGYSFLIINDMSKPMKKISITDII